MNQLYELREWLTDRIDGSIETRGEDSLISGFIAQINALERDLSDLKQRILPQFAGRTERAERARDGVLKAVEDAFLQHHAATQEQADFANAILRTIRKGNK